MSKVHLYKENCYDSGKFKMQCGFKAYGSDADLYETIDPTKVTCENCKRTDNFKELERTHNEVMQIGADIMENYHRDEERRANSHKMAEMFEAELKLNQNDPAIDLLNEVAELIKISGLSVDEKLQVIDFIESRVRKAKL